MSINFYLHTPLPDTLNERRAIIQVARQLHKQVAASEQTYTLIANVSPDHDPKLGALPQLDALLLTPKFAALLEFKAYFDPIIGQSLNGKWFATHNNKKQPVLGGSHRNPYLQVKNAKIAWQSILEIPLHAFLLFYPYLHPHSRLPKLSQQHAWLAMQSIEQISALIFNTRTDNVNLDAEKQTEIAETILHCRPWAVESLLVNIAGHLHVVEPNQPLVRYPIQPFDSFTIGRSKRINHLIRLNSPSISSSHAHLFMAGTDLFIEDLESKNGIFHNGQRLTAQFKLLPNKKVLLGGLEDDTPQIWYTPHYETHPDNPTLPTF